MKRKHKQSSITVAYNSDDTDAWKVEKSQVRSKIYRFPLFLCHVFMW